MINMEMKNCYFKYSKSNISHYFTWDDISFQIGHFDLDRMNDKPCDLELHYTPKAQPNQEEYQDQ